LTLNRDIMVWTITCQKSISRSLAKETEYIEEMVETSTGRVLVAHSGDRSKPVLLTYHDLGLNYVSNYQAFFNYPEMKEITSRFQLLLEFFLILEKF